MRRATAGLIAALALFACSRPVPKAEPTPGPVAEVSEPSEPAPTEPAPVASSLGVEPETDPTDAASAEPVALVPPVGLATGTVGAPPAAASAATASPTSEDSFAPRDECGALPGWKPFRDKLTAAIATRNGAALARLADPAVKLDFGGGAGPAELQKRLARKGLWHELATVMSLGCSVEGGIAALPWYFWRIPPKVDPAEAMLVAGQGVPLRARPAASAPAITSLDWPIVILADKGFDPAARFTRVRTRSGGQEGFVEARQLRSLLARRIVAEQAKGEWRITAIVAGD